MNQPLFFRPSVTFEKTATETVMPDDPNEWSVQLLQEVHTQVPVLADFEPHIVMDRVDAEKGFGFGHVEISNKSEAGPGQTGQQREAAGMRSVRIPIIINRKKLQPLDLLITDDSKVLPLTEQRLRSAIFRPQPFDVTSKTPGDQSMVSQLYPPFRGANGMGSGMGGGHGTTIEKGASAGPHKVASILAAIMPSINESDYQAFFDKVAGDRGLQSQLSTNHAAHKALQTLSEYNPTPVAKLAGALLGQLKPSVVQLRKEAQGYTLKTASHAFWQPREEPLSRGQATELFGGKVVLAADREGSVTMTVGDKGEGATPPPAAPAPLPEGEGVGMQGQPQQNPEADVPKAVDQFGVYKVQTVEGTELIGYVFPNLIDIDGTSLPISLFTNGSHKAVQADIVGVGVASGASLMQGPPQGTGAFVQTLPNGRAQALVPMTLQGSASQEGRTVMQGETYDGRPVTISVQPNIKEIVLSGDTLLVPETFGWLPLDKAEGTELAETADDWNREKTAAAYLDSVELRHGGGTFSVSGLPVEKLAYEQREFLDLDETFFLLGGLGVDLDRAQQKLGEAAAWSRPVQVRVGRTIKTASDAGHESRTRAKDKLANAYTFVNTLRKDLLKEAAMLPDPAAVDTVLSLGFLNPENLGAFVSYLPVIDESQSKMCELLIAARLGMTEAPVGALERAIKATEETIQGLRALAFAMT